MAAFTVAACAAPPPVGPDAPPSPALGLEAEVGRVAATRGPLWPGFDPLAVPLAVYDGTRTYLFRHPAPPPEFEAVPGAPDAAVYDGRHEAVAANSSAEVGGVPTATVLTEGGAPAPLVVHEAFHVFQRGRHPGWTANEADLFVYPVDDAALLALRRLETAALQRALADEGGAACWARAALALRERRYARLDSASVAYERGTELNEGLASYVEGRAGGPTAADALAVTFGPADVRRRAYATGHALARLLDLSAPGWQERFEADDRQTLDGALVRALGEGGPACTLDPALVAEAERRAAEDVAALAADRARSLDAFGARAGWRVVVEAGGEPLWPEGFDPLNVERVGAGRVLHARYVRVGNGAGRLEALDAAGADVEALTDGVGPHPLFNGVRRVEVAGLDEPEVRDEGGTVTVRAPGVAATFRGAVLDRRGRTVTVRLAP